ncbi:iron complex transport system substrate-binding protein [Enterococcus sp. PF1-24]|uniref:ABC transporter substrate-binding protein n=1 Tax=unclassified Enterococcus TaxID=2608891 RepID=UPI0024745792|nr:MULTISPECIES: ABC transporter substrate-binding protein [unclassified Enterococcus]MDH6364905.1 iron complex transport system substrate-binding protein [Enterococcus sp. PFB1-1]MDH6402006.1 iron complex transport system substrate-binding protein [Enterococcus sp. PF1-24]
MKKICLLLSTVFLLTACGTNKGTETSSSSETLASTTSSTTTEETLITTYDFVKNPVELAFEKVPERVVAVYQSPIEIMLALGLADHLVATAQLDTDVKPEYQAEFADIQYYDVSPGKEEILGLNPDFIFSWYSYFGPEKLGDIYFWNERGTNTYIAQNSGIQTPNTLAHEYEDIRNIAKIFKVEERGEEIIAEMEAEIAKAKDFVEGKEKVKAIIVEVAKDGMYRVYGADSIGGDMAQQVGAELVMDKNGTISKEELVALNPEVIFSVYFGEAIESEQAVSSFTENESLQNLSAVKNQRVEPIVLSEVYATGIRTFDGIVTISKGLYPDLYE